VRLKNKYSNNPNIEVVLYTTRVTNQILQDTQNNINEISKILSSGVFNMGDADRLDFIRQYKEDTEEKWLSMIWLRLKQKNSIGL
jgi:hypothetical protein